MAGAPPPVPRLARNASISFASLVYATAVVSLAGVLTARLLGPSRKGTYSVFLVLANATASVAVCGIDLWITREVARRGWAGAVRSVTRAHLARILPAFVVASAGVTIGFAAYGNTGLAAEIGGYAAAAVGAMLFILAVSVPLGDGRMARYAGGQVAYGTVFSLAVGVLLALRVRSVALVLAAMAAARAAGAAIAGGGLRAARSVAPPAVAERKRLYGEALRFGLPGSLANLLTYAIFRLDVLVVALFRSATAVGLYTTASTLTELLLVIPDAVSSVLLPHVARDESAAADTPRVARATMLLVGVAGAAIVVVAHPVVRFLFGRPFVGAVKPLPPLVVGAVFIGLWKVLVADLAARGDTRARAISAAIGLVTMLGLDFVLVPTAGIVGAGFGAAAGYGLAAAYAGRAWWQRGGDVGQLVRFRLDDLTAVTAAVARFLTRRGEKRGAASPR